mgnify:CR=1 FL=1
MYEDEIHFRNCYLFSVSRFDPGDLDLWPSDTKIFGFSAAQDGCVDQVWERKVKVFLSSCSETKRLQTDRPTDMCKAVCPLFFEGGHKKLWKVNIDTNYKIQNMWNTQSRNINREVNAKMLLSASSFNST